MQHIQNIRATNVTVLHTGWGNSPEWDEAQNWFVKAWDSTLSKLQSLAKDKFGSWYPKATV
jgi:hypothetical protein